MDIPSTARAHLRPIDRQGLIALCEQGRRNPSSLTTHRVHTVSERQYRSLSYAGDHAPLVADEPLYLLGQNTAPAPGEIMLSCLGGCLAVGIMAVATWKQVMLSRLELILEGDLANPAEWGVGGALEVTPELMGFLSIRVKVLIEGNASADELEAIVEQANHYSPAANSLRNPVPFELALAAEL